MAIATPNGTEKIAVPIVNQNVPTIAGQMPPARMPSRGAMKRNSAVIAGRPCTTMTPITAMIGMMTAIVTKTRKPMPKR